MPYSLNEIEAMCKKATRGAGLPWGIAEEAGKAARWLASHDLPGPEMLSTLLALHQDISYHTLAPVSGDDIFHSGSNTLCPLLAGAALTDRIHAASPDKKLEFRSIACPLLLAPYISILAKKIGSPLELLWDDVELVIAPDGSLKTKNGTEFLTSHSMSAECRVTASKTELQPRKVIGREVDAESWNSLTEFSSRIYAPATEASRKLGAG